MSEAYWRRVLRQDEWRAGSPGSTGKTDPCPLKRNASGNWGSRGTPLAGSRGWPRVEGLGREASLPSLAFWELFLHRKSSPGGSGGGAPPQKGVWGNSPTSNGRRAAGPLGRGRRRRPKDTLPENYRSPPARVSLCEEVRRGGAPPFTGGLGAARPRQRPSGQRKKTEIWKVYLTFRRESDRIGNGKETLQIEEEIL